MASAEQPVRPEPDRLVDPLSTRGLGRRQWLGSTGTAAAGGLDRLAAGAGWLLIAVALIAPCVLSVTRAWVWMPAQDATPEMLTQQTRDIRDAEILLRVAWAAGLCVLAAGVWLIVWGRRLARRPSQGDKRPA